jgi:hypothetical protein
VRHYEGGLPPSVAGDRVDRRVPLPRAALVVIDDKGAEGVFMFRFDEQGGEIGDTWHSTADDALRQAAFEYERQLTWETIPSGVQDLGAFVRDEVRAAPRGD